MVRVIRPEQMKRSILSYCPKNKIPVQTHTKPSKTKHNPTKSSTKHKPRQNLKQTPEQNPKHNPKQNHEQTTMQTPTPATKLLKPQTASPLILQRSKRVMLNRKPDQL